MTDRTRIRVLEAIRELNYRPNKAARNLAAKRSTVLKKIFEPTPYVVMDANGGRRFATVAIDHLAGSRRATEYLIAAGHRRIACISGPLSWRCAGLRRVGWRHALAAHRLPLGPACDGEWSAEGGYRAARKLLETKARFSGIVAANDQMALGVLEGFAEAGVSVPGDVSVIGFDNMPESRYFRPPLTTVHHDFDLLGSTKPGVCSRVNS